MKRTIVINLIGGPGTGKSTAAAGIFCELKKRGVDSEMALEYAKDKVWEESFRTMDDQLYIFAKQFHKLWRLQGKVDVIITDSPLLLSIYYNKETSKYFNDFVLEQYNRFENLLYIVGRDTVYEPNGRLQTEEEAKAIDDELLKLIDKCGILPSMSVNCKNAVDIIVNDVLAKMNNVHDQYSSELKD